MPAESNNIEIFLRVKPVKTPSRHVTLELGEGKARRRNAVQDMWSLRHVQAKSESASVDTNAFSDQPAYDDCLLFFQCYE